MDVFNFFPEFFSKDNRTDLYLMVKVTGIDANLEISQGSAKFFYNSPFKKVDVGMLWR